MTSFLKLILGLGGIVLVGLLAVAALFFFLLISLPVMLIRSLMGYPRQSPKNVFFRYGRPGRPEHGPRRSSISNDEAQNGEIIDVTAEVVSTRDDPTHTPSD